MRNEQLIGRKLYDMIREKKQNTGPIVIDLTGPDGNAFVLLGKQQRKVMQ